MADNDLGQLLVDRRTNGAIGWLLVGVVVATGVSEGLAGDPLWAAFALAAAVIVGLPAVAHRDPTIMVPWEVVVVAALPILGRAVATLAMTNAVATYLSVAGLALIVAVELQVFTRTRLTVALAIVFVVLATLATAGVWAVVRWLADAWIGTSLITSERVLMWEFVYSTVAGIGAGGLFELYFRRRVDADERLRTAPTAVETEGGR